MNGVSQTSTPANPRPAIVVGIVVLAVTFGGFGVWSALAPLASAVIAPGVVKVDTNRKTVQHPEGGVVMDIQVRDGDRVEQGSVLIRLDKTRAEASVAILRSAYDSARAVESRLIAERDGEGEIDFPPELIDRASEPATAKLMSGQTGLFHARRTSLYGEVAILKQREAQLEQNITGLKAQQKAKERQSALIESELEGLIALLKKGFTERTRVLALEREAARLEGERGEILSEIARADQGIGETRMQVLQLQKDFREGVVTELRDVQTRIAEMAERVGAAQHSLSQVEIKAPADGVVVDLAVHTVGGVIQAGDRILDIVPANDRLVVEAKVQVIDIDDIQVGQLADVRLTAFKQRTTPQLNGEVRYVSADRITNERSGTAYYLARVEVTDAEVARLDGQALYPGMPADVMIKTGERTVLDYLVEPIAESMVRAWRER